MWSFASISIAFLALAVIAASDLRGMIGGLSPMAIAGLLAFVSLVSALSGRVLRKIRQQKAWQASAAVSLLVALVPVVMYMKRKDLVFFLDRYIGDIHPGYVAENLKNEAVVARRSSGGFMLIGDINGYTTRFIFDTGATSVVLMIETAKALGIKEADLSFSEPVYTANGRTLAAPYTIKTLSIGPITEKNVRALIAQRGTLTENLLGMTFLDRLTSYEVVSGNRLILRGGGRE